ncbi:MAG: hypothetical protein J6W95_05015, partial [Bacteroidales bacterium]|nr:hypothetical protein [Bacteroidales bacterium]
GAKADAKVRTSSRTAKQFPKKNAPKTEKNAPAPPSTPFLEYESGRKHHFTWQNAHFSPLSIS